MSRHTPYFDHFATNGGMSTVIITLCDPSMHPRSTVEGVFERAIGHQLADTLCNAFRGESQWRGDFQLSIEFEVGGTDNCGRVLNRR